MRRSRYHEASASIGIDLRSCLNAGEWFSMGSHAIQMTVAIKITNRIQSNKRFMVQV